MIRTKQILGLKFFDGNVDEAVAFMHRHGGYLVAPSGTCFARLRQDEAYRRAILSADLAIADSGLMVLTWRLLRHEKMQRISGLKYLKQLLAKLEREGTARLFWILPGTRARQKLLDYCRDKALPVRIEDCYIAPKYGLEIEDRDLLALAEQCRPADIVMAIGSGPQEKLGHYLCENLSYRPAIHCTGAALGFITGDQVAIPDWADRFFVGWLLRLIAQPHRFIPRLIRGFELPWLIARYGNSLPPVRTRDHKSEFPPSARLRRDRQ